MSFRTFLRICRFRWKKRVLSLAALLVVAIGATTWSWMGTVHAQDVVLPKEAKELSFFSPLAMGIWKPKGDGPFPAVILVHTCGGLRQQLVYWRKEAIRRNYVAFIIDSFSPRGSRGCVPGPAVPESSGVGDVLAAADHLATFPFVDRSRIALIGMSWGAVVGLLAASPVQIASPPAIRNTPLRAVVSLYPNCRSLPPVMSTPVLVLMGDQDTETPPDDCLNTLPVLRDRKNPVEWHLFKGATHCWDCSDLHNQRLSPPWAGGRSVIYLYDSTITDESSERAFEFLSRHLELAPKN